MKKQTATFTDEERAAMQERARELKAEATRGRQSKKKKADGESDVLAKIAAMPEPDRSMAQQIHDLIMSTAPTLVPKTWYGMPAYARNDKVICFFQSAAKFTSRYATLGFSDQAQLDDGNMWPTSFALKKITAAEEKQVKALIKKAIS